jgi:hypothetical protein
MKIFPEDDEFIDEMYKDACGGRVMDIEDLITTAKRMKYIYIHINIFIPLQNFKYLIYYF